MRFTLKETQMSRQKRNERAARKTTVALAELGFFFEGGGNYGNPSERSERALKGSGLTGEWNLSVCELGRGHG